MSILSDIINSVRDCVYQKSQQTILQLLFPEADIVLKQELSQDTVSCTHPLRQGHHGVTYIRVSLWSVQHWVKSCQFFASEMTTVLSQNTLGWSLICLKRIQKYCNDIEIYWYCQRENACHANRQRDTVHTEKTSVSDFPWWHGLLGRVKSEAYAIAVLIPVTSTLEPVVG